MIRRAEKSIVPLATIILILIMWPVFQTLWKSYWYDTKPVLWDITMTPLTRELAAGGNLEYIATYSKRPGCTGVGDLRLEGRPDAAPDTLIAMSFKNRVSAGWPVGINQRIKAVVEIPPKVPAGIYEFYWVYWFDCEKSGSYKPTIDEIVVTSPRVPFRVITPQE